MFEDLLQGKSIILVCGSGGVGKTTVSATLAIKGAQLGRKVVVLTIDPARRLATSLGLKGLTGEPKKIQSPIFEKNGRGELYAMMLDTKRTFDQLISKYAPSKEIKEKILNNQIYQKLSDMIVGSQEYMAMEKLYEFSTTTDFDLIVIDTPPTTHAIDFLNAPSRMVGAISNSMIHLLVKPAMRMGKSGLKIIDKGAQIILKVFDRIIGFAFLQEMSEMLIAFHSLLDGFEGRAEEVKKILEARGTGFILVSAPEEKSVEEGVLFSQTLKKMNMALEGIVLNRMHPLYKKSARQRKLDLEQLVSVTDQNLAMKMMEIFDLYQKRAELDGAFAQRLGNLLQDKPMAQVPLFNSDVHDMKGLQKLGEYL